MTVPVNQPPPPPPPPPAPKQNVETSWCEEKDVLFCPNYSRWLLNTAPLCMLASIVERMGSGNETD